MNLLSTVFGIIFLSYYNMIAAQSPADKAGIECAQKFPIQQAEKDDLTNGNFDKITQNGKCYIDCFAKTMNFMTNNALNETNIIAFYTSVVPKATPEIIKGAITKCANSTGEGCDKLFNVHKCLFVTLNAKPAK